MSDCDDVLNSGSGASGTRSATVPGTAVGRWALGLSALGVAAWIVLPVVTAVFGEKYTITNSGLMPAIGMVLIVVAAAFNVLCLWLWKERSALNIAAAVITIPAALFLSFMVLGQLGVRSGPRIPDGPADVSFATIEGSTREGQALVLSLTADPEGAREIGRPVENSKYPVAQVRVDQNTTIISGQTILGFKQGDTDDVLAAKHVSVWFSGPVAGSDPVQVTAGTIVID